MTANAVEPPQMQADQSEAPGKRLLDVILEKLDDDKAENVVVIEMAGKSSMCDYMVVASGRSQRQVAAIAEHLRELLKPLLPTAPPVEGLPTGDWVLVDGGDVVVHLFRPEVRAFYQLERMWGLDTPLPANAVPPSVSPFDDAEDDAGDEPTEA